MAAKIQNDLKFLVQTSLENLFSNKNLTYQIRKRIILIRESSNEGQRSIRVMIMKISSEYPHLNFISLDLMW